MHTSVTYTLSYTTLFRSPVAAHRGAEQVRLDLARAGHQAAIRQHHGHFPHRRAHRPEGHRPAMRVDRIGRRHPEIVVRSEEHTSELQSRENLVCRLLLEK